MGITDRKIRQKEEVRASILEAAWDMVLAEGWQSLSIRKIADAIEYSVPVIYSHFENKDAILLEFNKKGFTLLVEKLREAKERQTNAAEQIRAMGRAYWDFAFSNMQYYQLMFGLGMPTCEAVRKIPAMVDFNTLITGSIEDVLRENVSGPAKDEKELPFDPFLKFQSFWSMLHGLISINMFSRPGHGGLEMAEKVREDLLCSFIRGIQVVGDQG